MGTFSSPGGKIILLIIKNHLNSGQSRPPIRFLWFPSVFQLEDKNRTFIYLHPKVELWT